MVFRQHNSTTVDLPPQVSRQVNTLEDAINSDPDAVIVSGPASQHVMVAEPFVERGKCIFIEKPLESNGGKLVGFVDKVKQSTGFVMVGYVLRFLPLLHQIKSAIEDGRIGKVRTAFVQTGQYLPDWRPKSDYRFGVSAQKSLGGGVLLELSHELDYASFLFGLPQSLMCSAGRISDLEMDVEDSAHILFEYDEKRVAIQIDFLQRVAKMGLQIVGSEATLEADLIKETATIITPEHPEGEPLPDVSLSDGNEIYLRQFDTFFCNSFSEYSPRYRESVDNYSWASVEQASRVIDLVDAAKLSNEEGRRIEL